MSLDFYYVPGSGPCRAVLMTAKALGVELNLKHTSLKDGEHLKPEFVKVRNTVTILFVNLLTYIRRLYSLQNLRNSKREYRDLSK